ncbi:hypothetical protein [Williamsia sterculiae]|nr:hypothetical protein [Williamsia sterculiae]
MSRSRFVGVGAFAVLAATAAPAVAAGEEPTTDVVAGEPVPVSSTAYSYLATHALTERAQAMDLGQFVASVPVPPQYRSANLDLSARIDTAVDAALRSPGGCVQLVVDPKGTGGALFDYNVVPVEGQYCD